jgi:hypothetical protein
MDDSLVVRIQPKGPIQVKYAGSGYSPALAGISCFFISNGRKVKKLLIFGFYWPDLQLI